MVEFELICRESPTGAYNIAYVLHVIFREGETVKCYGRSIYENEQPAIVANKLHSLASEIRRNEVDHS